MVLLPYFCQHVDERIYKIMVQFDAGLDVVCY